MKRKIMFSILKLIPDEIRGESINIGLVAFHEKRTDVRVIPQLTKIKYIDPNISFKLLDEFKNSISGFFVKDATIEDRHAILSTFPTIKASSLGSFMLANSQDYEQEIEKLLKVFVYAPSKIRQKRYTRSGIQVEIKKMFRNSGVLGKDAAEIENHLIIPNYTISANENLQADFVLKNAKWHVSETIDFRVSEDRLKNIKFNLAAMKAVTLDRASELLIKQDNIGVVPMLVYAAHPGHDELIEPALNMLGNYSDHIYNINDKDDKADYYNHMLEAAGVAQLH